jgi:sarcosine oxidase
MLVDVDVAVIGLGAMGSAACAQLAARGVNVAGFEQFDFGHELGASAGRTRIIRKAYFEGPFYVPLLERSYGLWRELEGRTGLQLLDLIGVLAVGDERSGIVRGTLSSAKQHGLDIERLDTAQLRRRYPMLHVLDGEVGVLEREAGVVFPERGIAAHLAWARESGALLRDHTEVIAIEHSGDAITLALAGGKSVCCARLIVCAGPWAQRLQRDLDLPLQVERNVQFWFAPERGNCTPRDLPAFLLDRAGWSAPVYGVPDLGTGVKFAEHGSGVATDADALRRDVGEDEVAHARQLLEQWIPCAAGPLVMAKACMYTLTPDRHFAIGLHSHDARIVVACGFSGHGYKFAPVVGEIVADLAMDRRSPFDLSALSPDRRFGHG